MDMYRYYEGRMWKRGYTTGSCAAAAAKGAVLALVKNQQVKEVEIVTPLNTTLTIPVHALEINQKSATCSVIKDGGDDPDITHGLEIKVKAVMKGSTIEIRGGKGVGTVTKPGLAVSPGQPAINPVPRKMIQEAVQPLLEAGQGVELEIIVPGGEEAARKTLNPKLGIVGGISILGTTGIVEPMSEEAFKSSLVPQISLALAMGYKTLVLTPGRMGQRRAMERWRLPEEAVVQMSNFVGFMLQECCQRQVANLILYGHIGKLIKIAGGIFHTHSKVADARLEILTAHAALQGASMEVIDAIMGANTIEEAVGTVKEAGMDFLFEKLAQRVSAKASEFVQGKIKIGTILTSLSGETLGQDESASLLLEELRCN